jgi:hypothetical protein
MKLLNEFELHLVLMTYIKLFEECYFSSHLSNINLGEYQIWQRMHKKLIRNFKTYGYY